MLSLHSLSFKAKLVAVFMLISLALNVQARPSWKDGSDDGSGGTNGSGKGKKATTEKIQIATAPQSQSVEEGPSVLFSVDAQSSTGSELTYQWRFNGVDIELANLSSYQISSASIQNSGSYSVFVAGSTATKELFADLQVSAPQPVSDMVISDQPQSQALIEGDSLLLGVGISSSMSVTYQWRKNGVNLSGQDQSTLNIPAVSLSDAGTYDVVLRDGVLELVSNQADVQVELPAPASDMTILTQPASVNVTEGEGVQFSIDVSSSNAVSYQWRKDGLDIIGANGASLLFSAASLTDVGEYDVVLSDGIEVVNSGKATLWVEELAPVSDMAILTQPVSISATEGESVQFSIQVSSSNAVSYQWRKNGLDIPSANSSTYSVAFVSQTDVGNYDVLVSDGIEFLTSASANLNVEVVSVGATINLNWLAPDARDDGSYLAPEDIAGYVVYMSVTSHGLSEVFNVDASSLNLQLPDMPSGDYEFRVATIDLDGIEGVASEILGFSL